MLFYFKYYRPYRHQRGYSATIVFISVDGKIHSRFTMALNKEEDDIRYYGSVREYHENYIDLDTDFQYKKNEVTGLYGYPKVFAYLVDYHEPEHWASDYSNRTTDKIELIPIKGIKPDKVIRENSFLTKEQQEIELAQDLKSMGITEEDL
jgi:hypothetical protein